VEFPKKAKDAISKAFYDKVVEILDKKEALDDEGGVIKGGETIKSTFKGNVQFLVQEQEQLGVGLVKRGDIQITCPTDTEVAIDDILRYANVRYTVISVLPYDSHLTIVGQK